MADSIGQLEGRLAMTDFLGSSRFTVPGGNYYARKSASGAVPSLLPADADIGISGELTDVPFVDQFARPIQCFDGLVDERWDLADVWFDLVLVRPLSFALGNILSTQTDTITVYSSYRSQTISLDTVVNNLGLGVNLIGLPSLPALIQPQSGFEVTLEVTTEGQPTLNDTIDFTFDVGLQQITITGHRIVMFPLRPEAPLTETVEFLTDVMEHIDGSEQRVAVRTHPRQAFEFRLALDGVERQFAENLLYDWQSRVFGVPVWTEPAFLTSAASVGQSSVNVDETAVRDFRVGGLAIVFTDRFTFDAQEIASIGPTSITFTSPLTFDHGVGTQVLPLATCYATPLIRGRRALNDDEELNVRFRVIDNNRGDAFADASAFASLNSRPLLDGPNAAERAMTVTLQRRLVQFDNAVGRISVASPWSRHRKSAVKGFVTHDRQELYDVRRLLHFLRGRQIAFYLPTFQNELTPTINLQDSTPTINIANVGFARFAQQRSPSRGILRVVQKDGTTLTRNIVSSGEIDSRNETITVDVVWPSEIAIDDIERIEYVELVRADTDRFEIEHANALGDARLSFPVKTVFE